MPSFNRVVLIGRLTRDPELRYTPRGVAVSTFSLAVDRRAKNAQGEKVTDFFRCQTWRQSAEFVNEYVKKGRLVAVEGRIEMNDAVGQDGVKHTYITVVCDGVNTLDSSREPGESASSGQAPGQTSSSRQAAGQPAPAMPDDGDDFDDSDPFAD